MVAQEMPFVDDSPEHVGGAVNPIANHKKRCARLMPLKQFQDCRCRFRVRSVIECEQYGISSC